MPFFRSRALRFSLTGERRFAFDEIGDQAGKIGEQLRVKQDQLKEGSDKMKQIEQIKEQAHKALRTGTTQINEMRLFALQTNVFLKGEEVQVDGKQARVLKSMLKDEYVKTLIEKAKWNAAPEKKNELVSVSKHMEANKTDLLSRHQANVDAFLKDPASQLKTFVKTLAADPEMEEQNFGNPDAEAVLLLLLDAKWITADQKKAAEQAMQKPASKPEEKKVEVQDTRLEIEKYLDAKRIDMLATLQGQFEQFMEDPAGTFDAFKNAINQKLQEYPNKRVVHATSPAELINVLYKANWITRRPEKDAALRKLQPVPPKVMEVPSKPSESARAPEVSVESFERDLRVLRNAPVGSPDWNKAANARMQICVMQFSGKPVGGLTLDERLARMGGMRTGSNEFRIIDQRKMFYALRDYDVGGSLMERDMGMQDIQDANDRSAASRTGDQNKLEHWRIVRRNMDREKLRLDAKRELQQVRGGERSAANMPAQEQLWLEQFPNYTFDLEAQALRTKMDELQSNRKTDKRLLDIARHYDMSTVKFHWRKATDEMKKNMLADLRRFVLVAAKSAGEGQSVPLDTETMLEKLEDRRAQMMLDSVYFDDAVFLQKAFPQANGQDVLQLRNTFWNILRTWDDSNLLRKQQLLKEYDDLLAKMHKLGDRFGGGGIRLQHYEDVPKAGQESAPRVVTTLPKGPNQYLGNVDAPPTPAPEAEVKTNLEKMERELNDKFEELIQSPMYAPDAEEWKQVWAEKNLIRSPRERFEEKRTLLKRMEATKSGDLLKEVMYRKDKATIVVPLDRSDAFNPATTIMIWSKDKGFAHRLHYQVAKGRWSGDTDATIAKQYGIWVGKETGTTSYGKDYNSGITIHFTNSDKWIVQKTGTGTPFYSDIEADRNRVKESEAAKVAEVKRYAENKWNFNLSNAVQTSDGKKFGYYYEHTDEDEVVYAVDPGMTRFSFWNAERNTWDKMERSDVPENVLAGLEVKQYVSEKSLPKSMRSKKAPSMPVRVDTAPEQGENPNLTKFRKLNGELQQILSASKNAQTTSDVMDRQVPAVDINRMVTVFNEMNAILNQMGQLSGHDADGARELAQSMRKYLDTSTIKVGEGRQSYNDLIVRLEVLAPNTPAKPKLNGPKKGSETVGVEPMSKIRKQIAELAKAQESGDKESEKAAFREILNGEFKEIFNALDEGDDIELGSQLSARGLPSNREFVAELKKYVPQGYYDKLMQ